MLWAWTSYLLLYNKLPQDLMTLHSKHLLSHDFCGSVVWQWLSWVVLAQTSVLRLQTSEGLTGAGGFASSMTHLHGCGQETSVDCHVDLSLGLLKWPYDMAFGFPQNKWPEEDRESKESLSAFFFFLKKTNPECVSFIYFILFLFQSIKGVSMLFIT